MERPSGRSLPEPEDAGGPALRGGARTYLLTGTLWTLSGRLFDLCARYAHVLLILHFVDLATYGTLVFLLTFVTIPVAVAHQGLGVAALRLTAEHRAAGNPGRARAVLGEIRTLVCLVAAGLALLSPLARHVLPEAVASAVEPRHLVLFLAGFATLQPLLRVSEFTALGLKDARLRAGIASFAPALLRFGALAGVLSLRSDLVGLIVAEVLALAAAVLVAEALLSLRGMRARPSRPRGAGALYRYALPLLGSELMALGLYHADKLLLGYLSHPEAVGLYGVASRVAFLVIAPYWAASQTFAPLLAERWTAGRLDELNRSYRSLTATLLLVTAALAAGVIVNARWLLALFGPAFATDSGVRVVQLLALGLLATVLPGPHAELHRMSGKTHLAAFNTLLLASLNVTLNWVLIPSHGATGAAAATALSLCAANLSGFALLKLAYGFRIHPICRAYGGAVAAAAALVAAGFAAEARPLLGSLLIGAGAALGLVRLHRPPARGGAGPRPEEA